ncbi:UNVERIFIED_CONTAM: LytTR family transcriptional regulator, partial [Bacteroidetes bacterium 56_B9]
DTVRIFCDGEDVELQPQQILYAEMSARKGCLHLQGAERDLLYTTAPMAELADLWENHGFVRTPKSILVNMAHIRDLQS